MPTIERQVKYSNQLTNTASLIDQIHASTIQYIYNFLDFNALSWRLHRTKLRLETALYQFHPQTRQ